MKPTLRCLLVSLLALVPHPGAARPIAIPQDSTLAESLRLGNGLEIRLRDIPGATNVAVSVSCRAGNGYDAPGHEGLHELLAELQLTAAAGPLPERLRHELDDVRPQGWAMHCGTRIVTIVEVDQRARLPFLLHDVATRLAGVHVTGVVLDSARTFVRSTLAARRFGDVAGGLATRLGDLAAGTSDEIAVRKATGEGIREVTPAEAEAQLHALWVPSNCAVAIAGDLTDLDLRTLLERDFGGLAPGNPQPELPEENLHAAARSEEWQGLPHVCGGVGILAPGLADTLSPSFYLATITMAGWLTKYLGLPAAPLRSRFEYVPLDEPELVRYYPKVDPAKPDVPDMVAEFNRWLDDYGYTSVSVTMMREVAGGVEWMFGGPLTFSQRRLARGGGELLSLLAGSMSTRVVFRGDDFWDLYRRRLESTLVLPQTFIPWMRDPAHQVGIVLTPGR